jgi:hypothetical protein
VADRIGIVNKMVRLVGLSHISRVSRCAVQIM